MGGIGNDDFCYTHIDTLSIIILVLFLGALCLLSLM